MSDSVVLWSDIGCPWAHVAVARLRRFRKQLGLEGKFSIDHRAFPLELVNERPTPKHVVDAEVPVTQAIETGAGWQVWQRPDSEWPVSTLLALEAVQAVKQTQHVAASEQLDYALRVAFFGESRCISLLHVVLDVARGCPEVDAVALQQALHAGTHRATVIEQWQEATRDGSPVKGSPHLFLPDGRDAHNPGIRMHWEGEHGKGFPIIDGDDPDEYENLLACFKRAA